MSHYPEFTGVFVRLSRNKLAFEMAQHLSANHNYIKRGEDTSLWKEGKEIEHRSLVKRDYQQVNRVTADLKASFRDRGLKALAPQDTPELGAKLIAYHKFADIQIMYYHLPS